MDDLLARALARGIITAEQREAILALEAEGPDSTLDPRPSPLPESREAFNAVTIAYWLGAGIVLFGFGWFLADRWRALGPGGVLAVSALYTTLFLLLSTWLRRHRFPVAAAFGMVLAVAMAPLMAWGVLKLSGLWPDGRPYCRDGLPFLWECTGKWFVLELVTIAAALAALRRVPHPLLMHPLAVALLFVLAHLVEAFGSLGAGEFTRGWIVIAGASVLLALAHGIDRRISGGDYGFWLWFAGLGAAIAGMIMLWDFDRALRHALPAVAVGALAVAVLLRRRLVLAFGLVCTAWYLGYLVFNVFRHAVALPVLLATAGLVIILVTVWVQRSYPRLVARADLGAAGWRRLPLGVLSLLAPALLALLMVAGPARARDAERRREIMQQRRVWTAHETRRRREAQRRRAADSTAAAAGDTAAARRLEAARRSTSRNRAPRVP